MIAIRNELENKKEIVFTASGWGALEGRKISNFYEFPKDTLSELQNEWIWLKEKGYLLNLSAKEPPKSYMVTAETLNLLNESLNKEEANHWFTYLHIGIINYALDNVEAAKAAWEKSNELCENAWASRNLSMLYKNNFNDTKTACKLIKRAVELCETSCRGLLCDAAKVLTECGDNDAWIGIFDSLDNILKQNGRLRLFTAIAYMNNDDCDKAKEYVNENFTMEDLKEGELSISAVWKELYGDAKPLPDNLNFRMYEV